MKRFLSASVLFALSALAMPILGQEPPKASSPKLLTPEGALNLRSISDLQFSPDGNRLAFVVTEPAKGERRARLPHRPPLQTFRLTASRRKSTNRCA